MPTLEELGQKTKAKYPEYAGLSDLEVGQRVVKKYPEYQAVITPGDTRSGLQKVSDFMGLGNVTKTATMALQTPVAGAGITKQDEKSKNLFAQSQALIKQAKLEKDPAKKKALLDQSRQLDQGIDIAGQRAVELGNIVKEGGQITDREMGMSNGEFALRRGGATALEVGSYMLPGAVGGPTASIRNRIVQGGAKGAVSGGLQGASNASTDSESILDALARTGTGAAVGAVTGAVLQGVLETPQAAKEWWNRTAKNLGPKAKEVYASTLKENIADKKFYKQAGGVDKVIDEASALKLPNTKNGMTKYLEEYGPEFERTVTQEINKTSNKNKVIDLDNVVARAKAILKKEYGADQTILDSADNWIKTNSKIYSGKTSLNGSNNLRKGLDKTVGGQLTQEINQGATAAKKAIATILRNDFKTLVPELKPAIRKYQLVAGLTNAMKKEPITGLAEVGTSATAAALGSMYGGPAAILSALGGLGLGTAIRSPGLKRAATTGIMNEARRAAPTVVRSAINASPVINPAIAAMQRALDNTRKAKTNKEKLP
jgi:hypothetical protein